MLLTRAITRGVPAALKMVKTMLESPAIVSQTPSWTIFLEVEDYSKNSTAEVSQSPVIVPGTGVKQYLNDNVAPSPHEWHLSGYIPGDDLVETTCNFIPVVMANLEFLWTAYDLGSRIIYKDTDQRIYTNCVIAELETNYTKDCRNKMPFRMTIKEIKTIEATLAEFTEAEKNALPTKEDLNMGTTGVYKVEDKTLVKVDKALNGDLSEYYTH
ncbi:MAG: hypothetical protein IKY09_07625 [Methanocorpusculum sp.]|nr:hypothetical protein [Methanocorpusculum sp.]MBR5450181.1 hypothetical protein [Methanocorpusculum sp.]